MTRPHRTLVAAAALAVAAVLGLVGPAHADPADQFPNLADTGVPNGVTLTNYTGPCVIQTDNTIIDSMLINNCPDGMGFYAKGIVVRKTRINTLVTTNDDLAFSIYFEDSEVHAGTVQAAAVGSTNITMVRTEVTGGETSLHCYTNCDLQDSYLHAQGLDQTQPWHLGAYMSNGPPVGYPSNMTARHNTIACDTPKNPVDGGCSGDMNLFGDFGAIYQTTAIANYFVASVDMAYCTYGGTTAPGGKPYPTANYVVFKDNIFGRGTNAKCASFGPVTAFDVNGTGNVWTNNTWREDGTAVPPSL
jgi:hypothetical protein